MKTSLAAPNYSLLTPEERFRLILAASERGDEVERDRLARAGDRIYLSMQDHAPYADAFDHLALLMFILLLEEAALYHDAFERCHQEDLEGSEDAEMLEPEDKDPGAHTDREGRLFDLLLAAGYQLRAEAEGWKLFCEKVNIPPFLLWQDLPGFDRLQRALTLAEQAAFTAEGLLKWANRIRPAGEPEWTEVPLTAETAARALEKAFQAYIRGWSGKAPS
jgi:hypothetical protein